MIYLNKMKLIVNTITSWDEAPRARHQVTNELVKLGHEVFFVEKNRVGLPKIIQRENKPNLTLISPFVPINYRFRYRIPLINEIYQWWLYRYLRKYYHGIPVINFDFTAHLLNRFFQKTVYYCNDEYIGNSKYPNYIINKYHQICERKVTRKSIICVTTAVYLTKKLSAYNSNVFEIRLGGPDLSNYKPGGKRNETPFINVGLVGYITPRNISYQLINLLLTDPSIQLFLIGPIENGFLRKLKKSDRLKLLGTHKNEMLYDIIYTFDVTIAPYYLKKVNKGTTPNKLLLYMACGKPVVVSDLPNLKGIRYPEKSVYIAKKDKDFLPLIRLAYQENNEELEGIRKNYALKNTWSTRIREFMNLLEKYVLVNE